MKREGDSGPAGTGFATVASGPSVSRWSPEISLNFGHRSLPDNAPGIQSQIIMDVTIPPNTTASVRLPSGEMKEVGSGSHHFELPGQ